MGEQQTRKHVVSLIDPPEGWKYGFPKPFPEMPAEDVEVWLALNGYPEERINYWLNGMGYIPYRIIG